MMAAAAQFADWEGELVTLAVLAILLALRSWVLSPFRRFPALRLERPPRLIGAHRVLILAPLREDAERHGPRSGIVIDRGFGQSERSRAIPRERLLQ